MHSLTALTCMEHCGCYALAGIADNAVAGIACLASYQASGTNRACPSATVGLKAKQCVIAIAGFTSIGISCKGASNARIHRQSHCANLGRSQAS